ncbi:MAG: glycosyltransferase family 39 protein [Nitrospirae bacterium]|nr:glycosyltransferase family 39 protein [Nitrospirota bacterium]
MTDLLNILQGIDASIFFLINKGASNRFFDLIMPFITSDGYLLLLPYLLFILIKGYKTNNYFHAALFGAAAAFITVLLLDWWTVELKTVITRIRPCNVFDNVNLLVGCSKSYSMPSNHASNSFGAALSLFYFTRGYIPAALRLYPLILAALIAFSRVYVGVHYPSDVIVGVLLGAAVSVILIAAFNYAIARFKVKPYATLLSVFLIAISLFRIYYIARGPLDLGPDEAHYWEWSRRLDWSYYSKGPMIAYLIYAGTTIFGVSIVGIRIMAVIFSALSSLFLYKLAVSMFSGKECPPDKDGQVRRLALVSAILFNIVPIFSIFGVIFTIDSPFIFFWIISLFAFWKAVMNEERPQVSKSFNWIYLGIFIGLGLLTKYTMVFFYLCGFAFLFFSEKRYLLKTFKPYLSLIISLLIFSPVILWNIQNDWVTIKHTGGQAHIIDGLKISLKTFFEFIGSQVGIITPLIFGMMLYAVFAVRKKEERLQSSFIFWFFIPVAAFFLIKSLQGKVQANWAVIGYITGLIALVWSFFDKKGVDDVRCNISLLARKTLVTIAIGMAIIVTIFAHYPWALKLSPSLDPSSRLRGWKQLGKEVSRIRDSISDDGHVLIFSDRYQVSSELAFYVKGRPKTYCINTGRRMNQYDLWPDINSDVLALNGRINAIYVTIGDTEAPPEVLEAFERVEKRMFKAVEGRHDHDKRFLRDYSIFIGYNFKGIKIHKPTSF